MKAQTGKKSIQKISTSLTLSDINVFRFIIQDFLETSSKEKRSDFLVQMKTARNRKDYSHQFISVRL